MVQANAAPKKKTVPPAHHRKRHLDDEREGALAIMAIDNIEQSELTASERGVLADDRERFKRLGAGAHLDDWLAFIPGLRIRRHLAMKLCHIIRPQGRCY